MPRIDPTQLLRTLSVLLSPHGGIKSSAEVGRLVQLMQKFSKKLVSKVIYVKILLASHPDLLELFLKEKGWELLNAWFDDAIKTLNWPLCAEMTQLFTKCPMTAQRLKENVEINLAPKLIRQLSCDLRVDATVRQNASQVLSKWMAVVATVSSPEPPMLLANTQPVVLLQSSLPQQPPPTSSGRTTRGSRNAQTTPKTNDNIPRVPVIVHTDFEEILNLDRMPTTTPAIKDASESEGQVWVGKGGSKRAERNARRRGALGQPSRKTPPPGRSKEIVDSEEEEEDSDEEYKPPQDDPFDTLLSSSISNEKQKVNKTMKLIGVIRNETLDEVEPEPVKLLQGLAMELSETLKKEAVEVKKEETDSKKAVEKAKEKEARREKERQERREKEKREERRKGEEKGDRKDRDKHKHSSDKEREKQREERRRKEKEREKQKEKERKEKKRESKPYRETEMRDKLDSTEKLKIKELAQKLREDSKNKKDDFQPTPSSTSLPKIPKVAKVDEAKKDNSKAGLGGKKPGPSFEDLMFSLNSSSAQPPIKPAPIKNKSRDLIASLYEDSPVSKAAAKQREEEKKKNENKSRLLSSSLTNGDKSKQNGASSPVLKTEETGGKPIISEAITPEKKTTEKKEEKVEKEEEKKATKRTSSEGAEAPKLKIKSQAQLKEGTMFGDFLSTIMPEQPKKKKIKLADLKAQKEAKAASENIVKPETEEKDDSLEKSLANAASSFSFYRDTMSETNGEKSPETDAKKEGSVSPPPQEEATVSVPSDSELPFEEPESALPREVRGILVLAKGPKRSRRIQWKPQETLVQVEYFELDETERVNVNKLKFEEQRKNEAIAEKAKMLQKQNHVVEDNRAWPGMQTIECELPEIDYGGNSNEKKEQEQRENKVLQILFFNNKLPNDPSEPDAAGGARIVTKPIPLEDTSGDEAYTDYSGEPWPAPIQEKENTPVFDNLLNNIQMQPELLKNLMGTALPDTGNPDGDSVAAAAALYAAQKAAEETLRKHGVEVPRRQDEILPMEQEVPIMNPSVPPPMMAPPFEEEFPTDYPPEFPADGQPPRDFYQQPPPPWQNGAPSFRGGPPHHRGGPYNRNGPPPNEDFNRGGFRGGPRGGGPMRDFHHNNHHNGYHHDRHHEDRGGWERRDDRRREGGRKEYSRPCKFWMEKGYCREENRCKFPHPQPGGR